ncbi:MAG: choice-of-anchor I family protein [Lachnospiraceae bacterium]|nr:choice-of-anchor I family protein [Agathobacter sp.]MDD6444269.1 choice-of-anchor I family protein [Lachnospiraceae bacterium]
MDFTILYYDGSKIIVKESSMKKYNKWTRKTAVLMAAALAAAGIPVTAEAQAGQDGLDEAVVDHLIINQVYGRGTNSDAPIAKSFIELYNPTKENVSLEGYQLELDNQSDNVIDKTIDFTGETVIGSKQSYLITLQENSIDETKLTYDLPEADKAESDISPDGTKLAAAVQHADYATAGIVAVFDCKDDGSLENPQYFTVGVQPDMVTFANNDTILSADEGEPRNGFGTDTQDPKGSVSVISLTGKTSQQVYFNGFTAEELTAKNILIGKVNGEILSPEADLEPEYIAVSSDDKTAYVSLQEANAVAVLNIAEKKFTGIYSVGFEDYSQVPVDKNSKDTQYEAKIYADIVGARMPDGIALYENAGKTYLVTANEGDSRVWAEKTPNEYSNETKDATITGKKITFLDPEKCAGLPNDKENEKVLYGGRSFTIFEVNADGLNEVYDSKDDFERITAEYIPDHFNCSNDNIDKDDRSGKKGPEPENVTIGTVNGKTYAFIAIERIGGIMVYDITDPAKAEFVNYINSREFASEIQGDVSPEGLCFVENQNGKITYTSAKQSVATVSQSGKITAQKSGNASITVTVTLKNGKTKVLNVMVKVK